MTGTITGRLDLDSLASSSVSTLSGTQVVDLTRDGVGPERLNQRLDLGLVVAAGS